MTDWRAPITYALLSLAIAVVAVGTLASAAGWVSGRASYRLLVASVGTLAALQGANAALLLGPEQALRRVQIGEISGLYLLSAVLPPMVGALALLASLRSRDPPS